MSPTSNDREFPGEGIRDTVHPLQYGGSWPAWKSPDQDMYLVFRGQGLSPEEARAAVAGEGRDPETLDVSDDPPATDALAVACEISVNWRAVWTFARQDGHMVVRSVALEPIGRTTPEGGITSAVLRELSPLRAVQEAAAGLEEFATPGTFGELLLRWRTEAARLYERIPPRGNQGGRPRLSDELLRDVALVYLKELDRGRGLLKRVGEHFNVSDQVARDWVAKARKAGFLTPAQHGKRGADPGPRLVEEMRAESAPDE